MESLWFSLFDLMNNGPIKASKAWPLYARQFLPQTKVISLNGLADLLGIEILEL